MTAPVVIDPAQPPADPGQQPPKPDEKPDGDKTFTQADVDRLIADRLKRAKPADYDELRRKAGEFDKLAEANQSDVEKLTARAEKAEREHAETVARALRLEVAFDKGLTPAQAKRLVGSSREELEADADEILRDFPALKPDGRPKGNADLGGREKAPPANPKQADLQQIEADLNASRRR
jgi:hypothetical protein